MALSARTAAVLTAQTTILGVRRRGSATGQAEDHGHVGAHVEAVARVLPLLRVTTRQKIEPKGTHHGTDAHQSSLPLTTTIGNGAKLIAHVTCITRVSGDVTRKHNNATLVE